MNDRERDEYKPLCNRCGQVITDIRWCEVTDFGGPTGFIPGRMTCSTPDCYDERGSRETGPLEPGGLTLEDRAWVRHYGTMATGSGS